MAEETPGIASGIVGMFNVFVDPAGLAKAVKAKLFWLWPLIVASVVFSNVRLSHAAVHLAVDRREDGGAQHAARATENAKRMTHTFTQVGVFPTPVFIVLFVMLGAWLVVVTGSMVGVRAKFRDVFSLCLGDFADRMHSVHGQLRGDPFQRRRDHNAGATDSGLRSGYLHPRPWRSANDPELLFDFRNLESRHIRPGARCVNRLF